MRIKVKLNQGILHFRDGTKRILRKMSSFLPNQKQPFFCCERNWHGYFPFKRCRIHLPLWAEVIRSVLVCRNQYPKKENFKMGKGGKEGFSINVTECHWRRTLLIIKITMLLFVGLKNRSRKIVLFPLSTRVLKSSGIPFYSPPMRMSQVLGVFANKISCLNYLPGLI